MTAGHALVACPGFVRISDKPVGGWTLRTIAGCERIASLRRLLTFKFQLQTLDPAYEARLQAATPGVLDRYLERVLTADSLAAVFAD